MRLTRNAKRVTLNAKQFSSYCPKSPDKPDLPIPSIGARGIDEIGVNVMAAAVANAITNATGKRVRDLPVRLIN